MTLWWAKAHWAFIRFLALLDAISIERAPIGGAATRSKAAFVVQTDGCGQRC
jgi:hypothetical protein